MAAYTISLNGQKLSVEADADMPLLWVLRDVVGAKGTKFGCGAAYCGACTVMLDGTAIRSCQIPVSRVGTRKVTTIEGVGASAVGARVQAAWLEIDVAQCGYCQAGQIVAATALLQKTPKPTDAEIEASMNGNLCRCATYNRIRTAIRKAAGMPASAAEALA
jgi:isoquinoline 1-oxidoreductase alpha subunit